MQRILFLLFSLFCFIQLSSQDFLKRQGTQIVDESGTPILLRGMGLGGWMLQEGYMLQTASFAGAQYQIRQHIEDLIGEARTDDFYDAWLQNHVRRADIEAMSSWGFNLVRLPMHYNLFTLPIEEEPLEDEHTWLDRGFVMVDSLVEWCRDNGVYVLLDLHAAPGGQGYNQGISDYDPSKPSLWEDNANKRKTIALWRRLAERYADEPVIAGYDLLNEPNWNLPGNSALRALYGEITDAIREVDNRHMIFIEGNWFANDFTALTFPWDDNMVYSPHKYWSNNETEDLSWVLTIRANTGYPIFFGESGENSNVWFRDAIRNFENNDMGWAWWPEKKVESISCPLSVTKTANYQNLLNYWNGQGQRPHNSDVIATLTQLTEDLKIENCRYQKDVIDAMFRQVYSDETVPYTVQSIPGVVYASEFDMGRNGIAYYDTEAGNYELSTGNYTPWNSGWTYRNDGVDLEKNSDNVNSNGYNVGFTATGEWIQYSVDVEEAGLYSARVRYAAGSGTGEFHLSSNTGALSTTYRLGSTLGWSNWRTYTLEDVILTEADNKLIFHIDNEGFNFSSIEFVKTGELIDVETVFLEAVTLDENTIEVNVNKPLLNSEINIDDFSLFINGRLFDISDVSFDEGSKKLILSTSTTLSSSHVITISYQGDEILAVDDSKLLPFTQEIVTNNLIVYYPLPGRLEAEDYFDESGVTLETTTDIGGGENVGYLDIGDYMDYYVSVTESGTYKVDYRTASDVTRGELKLQILTPGGFSDLHTVSFQATGGWQTWRTTTAEVELPVGQHHMRVLITKPNFNFNWMEFSSLTSSIETSKPLALSLYPNPASEVLHLDLKGSSSDLYSAEIVDISGRQCKQWQSLYASSITYRFPLSGLQEGTYIFFLRDSLGNLVMSEKLFIDTK